MTQLSTRRSLPWLMLAGIILIAGIIRFAAFPSTMVVGADGTVRTWIAMDWSDDPYVVVSGTWGPGHIYFLGAVIALLGEAFVAPIMVSILLSLATAVVLYFATQELFGDVRASLFVAAAYAVYPIAMRSGYINMAETPSNFFLALAFYGVVRVRSSRGTAWAAVLGGLCLTIASSMRYEVWAYIPLFALMLLPKFRLAVMFGVAAMLFPAYWMISCAIDTGDPLYSMNSTANWISDIDPPDVDVVERTLYFPAVALLGTAPLVGLLIIVGMALMLYRRHPQSVWMIPPVLLALMVEFNTFRGTLETQSRYALPFMLLLFPFMALAVIELLKRQWGLVAAIAILVTNIPLSYLGNYGAPHFVNEMYESALNAFSVVADTDNAALRDMSKSLNAALDDAEQDGSQPVVISDFFEWTETYYVVYSTHLEPGRIFVAPGAINDSIDQEQAKRALTDGEGGLLLVVPEERFAEMIGFEPGVKQVMLEGHTLLLGEMLDTFVINDVEIQMFPFTQASGG